MNLSKMLPPKPAFVLERERLTNRLRSWEDRKVVVIHGQAGQGKSTLASSYIRSLGFPTAWYNIDPEDDNPAVFLSCLGQAVQRTWPSAVSKIPLLPNNRYGAAGMHQSMGRWVSHVFGDLPEQSLIILDDCHATTSSDFKSTLKILIENTPSHVRFMLLSRIRPELDITRLKAARAIGEITGEDLKFNDREVQELFETIFDMRLSESEVELINKTAEGWAAGLVLMHEYLQARQPEERRAALSSRWQTGFHNQVFDYLAQEVFSHLPLKMQRFLLRTSIVDCLTPPLIRLLTGLSEKGTAGTAGTQAMIEELRKKNLFVTTSDENGSVVRYHSLFREFLKKKFVSESRSSEVKKLYSIASGYFDRSGDIVRTINLLIESGQYDKAASKIESNGRDILGAGQTRTILRWLGELPGQYRDRPWLLFYRAVALRFSDPRQALSFFEQAYAKFARTGRSRDAIAGRMLSLAGIVEACFYTGGDFRRMARAARKATALLTQARRSSPEARARLLLALGTACFFIGRLRQGTRALVEALELFKKIDNHFYRIHSAIYLAPCAIYAGDMRLARDAVEQGFEALSSIPDETGGEAALYMAKAMTALFEGSFEEAQRCIDKCHGLAHEYDLEAFDFLSLDIGGWLKTATGDYEEAEKLLSECKQKGKELNNTFFHASSAHLLAVNFLHQGRLEDALKEASFAFEVRSRMGSKLFSAVTQAVIGAIYLKLRKAGQAERALSGALEIFRRIGALQLEANVLLALAAVRLEQNRLDETLELLGSAFSIGERQGFTYYYLFTQKELGRLADLACSRGICHDYCIRLITGNKTGSRPWIRVFSLGGFRIERNGVPVQDAEWKGRLSKTFFKLLVAQAGKKIARDVIMDIFWPDKGGSARTLLNNLMRRIRRLLDPPDALISGGFCILLDGDMLYLNPETVWTDMEQFLSHIEAAVIVRPHDPKKALDEYDKAFGLYHGDFLQDDIYEDWAGRARDRIRWAYLKALEDAGQMADGMADKARACMYYERLFDQDHCNEAACRWLMSWHHAQGRRAESVRLFELCQRALSRELDAEPDPSTRSLYRSIIGG